MSFFNEKVHVSFEAMLMAFSDALNLVDSRLTDHHKQVAYICYELGRILELDDAFTKKLVMLALVHDIGAFREEERDRMISFEVENVMEHAVTGYLLLKNISFYQPMAEVILYHHTHYRAGMNFEHVEPEVAQMAQLIFLADRVSVLVLTGEKNVLAGVSKIIKTIKSETGSLFNPSYVTALMTLRKYDYFWLNLMTDNKDRIIRAFIHQADKDIDYEVFKDFTKMFVYSIDFRSRYTATHSIGVASVAKALAKFYGMDEDQAEMLEIAGYYHDIGKLMIPFEILDKPGSLDDDEYKLIRQHPYFTQYILDRIAGMSYIKEISSRHHEMIDGEGYPYRLSADSLSVESKLLTVADIFTALTETRPYRNEVANKEIRKIFEKLVASGKIDGSIAEAAIVHCDELHEINQKVQKGIIEEFDRIAAEKVVLMARLEEETATVL